MQQLMKPILLVLPLGCLVIAAAAQTPLSPVFYKTQNSDEWIRKTLHIQRRYARVLLVDGAGDRIKTVRVAPLELNKRNANGQKVAAVYPVNAIYKSVQEAVDAARGGDLIAVMPGMYAGFVIGDKPDASDGHYIHVKAMGK